VRVLYVTAAVIVLDQVSKLLVKGFTIPFLDYYHPGMQIGASTPILGDALRLTYIENPGMVFGIDLLSQPLLALFSFLASVGVFYYLYAIREEPPIIRVSLALILGGAIGNLVDRVFYGIIFGEGPLLHGKVVDFIDVNVLHLSKFGIFNVADAAVTTGVALLLLFHRSERSTKDSPLPTKEIDHGPGLDSDGPSKKRETNQSKVEIAGRDPK
jgi:signal peptidase II